MKKAVGLILILLSIIFIVGITIAFLSDKVTTSHNNTAGIVAMDDIEVVLSDENGIMGSGETTSWLPGDIITMKIKYKNKGNMSIYTKYHIDIAFDTDKQFNVKDIVFLYPNTIGNEDIREDVTSKTFEYLLEDVYSNEVECINNVVQGYSYEFLGNVLDGVGAYAQVKDSRTPYSDTHDLPDGTSEQVITLKLAFKDGLTTDYKGLPLFIRVTGEATQFRNNSDWPTINGPFITKDFAYTGNVQEFIVPYTGNYKLEVWGAQGGAGNVVPNYGGLGGYSAGTVTLTKGTILYVQVGGQGNSIAHPAIALGGYNGGGNAITGATSNTQKRGSGGGATDVRIGTNSLYSRVIVAGGGGGGGGATTTGYETDGAAGGGTSGIKASNSPSDASRIGGAGGTLIVGGAPGQYGVNIGTATAGSFGQGGLGGGNSGNSHDGGGGGGGWYGGGGGSTSTGGGGGSGWVYTASNYNTWSTAVGSSISSQWLLNSSYYLSEISIVAGNIINGMPTHDGLGTMTGNTGNGYAQITRVP